MPFLAFALLIFLGAALVAHAIDRPQTRLFRQIWLMERLSGGNARMKRRQTIAFDALLSGYELDRSDPMPGIHAHIVSLLSAAEIFDRKNRNHLGIKLLSVLTRELRNRELLGHGAQSGNIEASPEPLLAPIDQGELDARLPQKRHGQVVA